MPRILENDAYSLAQSLETMDATQLAQALDILTRYRDQQSDLGEPQWPTQDKAAQDYTNRLRGMFKDIKTVDSVAPSLTAILPYSQNPDADRARVANTAYMAQSYGKAPEEISASYDLYRNDYAQRFLQAPTGLDDLGFHKAAAQEIQKAELKEGAELDGIKAAFRGDDVVPALQAWQAKNADRLPDSTEFTRGFLKARETSGDHLEFADKLLKQIESNTGLTKGNGEQRPKAASRESAAEFEQSLAALADMKPKDRKQVYAIIGAKAEAAGYDPKGFWSQMLSELGKGTARMGSTLTTQTGITADVLKKFPEMFTNTMKEGDFKETDASIARRQGIGEMYDEIANLVAGSVDPVKPVLGWMNDTVETGLIKGPGAVAPFMMASAALGAYGAGALFTADFAEQNRRDLRAQGMDNDKAMAIGAAAAPLQAVTESLSNALQLGRFPAVQKVLAGFTKPIGGGAGLITRYVQNSAISLGTEFTEEQLQDNFIVPATQELLGALQTDVPDVDWSMYRNRAIESTPELLSVLAPMALVFGGTMTAAQANLSAVAISSQDMLEAAGFSSAQANTIRSETAPEAQIAKARELWGQRAGTAKSIEDAAKSVGERMKQLQTDHMAAQLDMERRGILPRMLRSSEDNWRLTFSDGSTADFHTHQDADAARWQWATDQLGKVHLATREALAQMEKNAAVGREFAVEFKPDAMTAKQAVEEGRATPAQIDRRIAQGEASGEVSEEETFSNAASIDKATSDYLSSLQILGSSANEFKDGVLRTTIRLYEGAHVLTLVEEKLEGDAKQILASKPGSEWMLRSLRNYEQISGDSILRKVPDSELTQDDLIEAWSSLGQSYLVGKSKKGAAIGKGGARRIFADVLKAGMGGAMNSETQFFNAVWRRAAKLSKLKREGKLGEDLTSELERQLGIDSQTAHETAVADGVAREVASYSEENPGPNGETFSVQPSPGGLSEAERRNILALVAVERRRLEKKTGLDDADEREEMGREKVSEYEDWVNEQVLHEAANLTLRKLGARLEGYSNKSEASYWSIPSLPTPEFDAEGNATNSDEWRIRIASHDAVYAISDTQVKIDLRGLADEETAVLEAIDAFNRLKTKIAAALANDGDVTQEQNNPATSVSGMDTRLGGQTPTSSPSVNPESSRAAGGTFSLRKFPLPHGLAEAAQKARGESSLILAYQAAQRGSSSAMVPIRSVYEQAKKYQPALTPAQFMEQINALNDSGKILVGLSETMKAVEAAGEFRVGGAGTEMAIPQETFSVRVTPAQDAEYLAAVEAGDMEKAQAMVDAAAKAAGYGVKAYAGHRSGITTYDPSQKTPFFSKSKEVAESYVDEYSSESDGAEGRGEMDVYNVYLKLGNSLVSDFQGETWQAHPESGDDTDQIAYQAERAGYDSVTFLNIVDDAKSASSRAMPPTDEYAIFKPEAIKSADPVTYNERGEIIPLSQRFNPARDEITYSLRSGDFSSRMAAAFSPFQRSPELRRLMGKLAHDRVMRLAADLIDKANVIRKAGDLEREARTREAVKSDELTKSGMKEADARKEAKRQASEWLANARKDSGSAKVQRDRLKAMLRTLDAILSAAPPEVRAKVGGYVKLAGLATDEAMLKEIENRISKLDKELSKWLKKEGTEAIEALFKKAKADFSAGKKAKGKLGPDEHYLFQRAEAASKLSGTDLIGALADLDARIDSDELTPEQQALAELERGILNLVGDLKHADAGRIYSALEELTSLYENGALAWKTKQIAKREARKALREALIADTGKTGTKKERQAMDKQAMTLLGKAKSAWLSVSSFHELLSYAFGEESKQATALVDAERSASNQYEDETQAVADEVEELFTSLAGGSVLAGERLRFDMSQPSIDAGTETLSQLQAIQALLMWKQEDGRRHMEGTRDEDGKLTSAWGYDQAWIDDLDSKLSTEARQVMAWIVSKYAVEHADLNRLYRERHGVNLPQHDNYAPLTVKPVQTKAGEMTDPVSGAPMTGSILTPGSLRTRSRSAIAEPDFRDALQTLIGHKKQMNYWKAYYDLAVEAQAVLGNREVMNSVHAAAGEEAVKMLRRWVDVLSMGGTRDAAAGLALTEGLRRITNRAATVGLLGRVSTLLVQSTQLAAASVKMPVGAFLKRFSRLMTGNLGWGDAIKSPFIQRRINAAPPIVRQAMQSLGTASRPNQITRVVRSLGQLLSGADGLFTAGTYAILLDYHREMGAKIGLTGAELEEFANTEAERATEQVAQPTRTATRSMAEITSTNPLAKVSWAYASESRQKLALFLWAASRTGKDPVYTAKVAFLTFIVGGMMSQILKNLWKEAKGDDDEKKWSPERLTLAALAGPLQGVPLASELMGNGGMLSGFVWSKAAATNILEGEGDLRDVDTLLSAAGYFNDTAAGVAALSHAGLDFAKLLSNLAGD